MRDYTELSKSVHCCVGCEESQCEICPRGDTPFSYIECKRKLSDDSADAIEELLSKVPHWISVEERLPEIDTSVLMCAFGKSVGEGTYRGYDGVHHVWKMYAVSGTYWDDEVTHWMPLPEAPKEVE